MFNKRLTNRDFRLPRLFNNISTKPSDDSYVALVISAVTLTKESTVSYRLCLYSIFLSRASVLVNPRPTWLGSSRVSQLSYLGLIDELLQISNLSPDLLLFTDEVMDTLGQLFLMSKIATD